MANPNRAHGFIAEFMFGNATIPLWKGITRSNQTIADGDAITASNGLIHIAPANVRKTLGVSAEAITGVTGRRASILFVPNLECIVFSGQYGSATSVQFTQGLIWSRKNIVGATGVQRLSSGSAASHGVAWIVGLKKTSAFGTYGEAMFVWTRSGFTARNNQTISGAV